MQQKLMLYSNGGPPCLWSQEENWLLMSCFSDFTLTWVCLVFRMIASPIVAPTFLSFKTIYSSVFINTSIYGFKKSNQPSNKQKQQKLLINPPPSLARIKNLSQNDWPCAQKSYEINNPNRLNDPLTKE